MNRRIIHILAVALLLSTLSWGTWSLLTYLGVPVHSSVLVHEEELGEISEACPIDNYRSVDGSKERLLSLLTCRGFHSFWRVIDRLGDRLDPFVAYIGISFLLFFAVFLWTALRQTGKSGQQSIGKWIGIVTLILLQLSLIGISITSFCITLGLVVLGLSSARIRFTLRPWHFFVLFFSSLLLIFTVLNFGKMPGVLPGAPDGKGMISVRRVVEPTERAYRNIGVESLEQLKRNVEDLSRQGCLEPDGQFLPGVLQFKLKGSCIYKSFATRVAPLVLMILVLLFELLVVGRSVLTVLRMRPEHGLLEFVFSLAIGVLVWIAILWTFAVLGFYTTVVGWALVIILPGIAWKHSLYWLRRAHHATVELDIPWTHPSVLLLWLLISYLALNFLNIVRPFPIGWDDLGSYINRPRLLVSYGHFIYSMAPFQWEYLTSLGFLLFGYDTIFGATSSMMINWFASLFSVFAIYAFARTFLGRGAGLLSAILYYFLPLVGHFSFADMKIDNAVFAMGTLSLLSLFIGLFTEEGQQHGRPKWQWIVLAGLLGGCAFGLKTPALMVIFAGGSILVGVLYHWSAFIGAVLVAVAILAFKGVINIDKIVGRIAEGSALETTGFVMAVVIVAAAAFSIATVLAREKLQKTILSAALLIGATLIVILPWMTHNNILHGKGLIGLEFGAPNNALPILDVDGRHEGKTEVDGRAVLTPPVELRTDPDGPHCEPTGHLEELDRYWGFRKGWRHYITLPWRTVHNLDSPGYYVTTASALLLFPLLLLLPYFWLRKAAWLRWLFCGTLFILIQWCFVANGIPWYGIGVFLGLCVGLEALVRKSPDPWSRGLLIFFVSFSILVMLSNRLWQFETQRNILEYSMGKITAQALEERTIPHYNNIADVVVKIHEEIPDRPYLYRMGTFIPYFIPRNIDIIGTSDHQLDLFNCLYQERDAQKTIRRLKFFGFSSMVFDTNTATIERDPNGSLHQKVRAFETFVTEAGDGIQVILNDKAAGIAFLIIP